jgi:hypothetical protein
MMNVDVTMIRGAYLHAWMGDFIVNGDVKISKQYVYKYILCVISNGIRYLVHTYSTA